MFFSDCNASSISRIGQWAADVAANWAYHFRKTTLFFGLELLSLVAFVEQLARRLAGQRIWIYVDNNNALATVSRGCSNTDVIAALVARLWATLQKYSICARFSWVPYRLNPPDLIARGRRIPFAAGGPNFPRIIEASLPYDGRTSQDIAPPLIAIQEGGAMI